MARHKVVQVVKPVLPCADCGGVAMRDWLVCEPCLMVRVVGADRVRPYNVDGSHLLPDDNVAT